MTLREAIIAEIEEMGTDTTIPQTKALADAILAAIREHVTSPEAVERARKTFFEEWDEVPNAMALAILAALGEEL